MNRFAARQLAMPLIALMLGLLFAFSASAEGGLGTYSSLKLDKTALTISPLTEGAHFTVANRQDGYEPITWSLSPASVAGIDPETGVITPKVKNGSATVTARVESGAKAHAKLTVKTIAATSLALNARSVTVSPGKSFRFKATVKPANATYRAVTWTLISQNSIPGAGASSRFDAETGLFTAGAQEGEVLILTAKTGAGRTASARITVKSVAVSAVKFKSPSATASIGKVYDLSKLLTVLPSNAVDSSVTWRSGDERIATIDQDGMLTTLAGGTVKITATSVSNPLKRAVLTVKVRYIAVKTITLNAANVAADAGDHFQSVAAISPKNATYPNLTWHSSDERVATVTDSGIVTAVAPGIAKITVKAEVDSAKATLTFRVRGGAMRAIKLSAIGDVVLGGDKRKVPKSDSYIGDGKTSYTRFKALYDLYGAGYFFKRVTDVLRRDDVTIANIEGSLTNATAHANKSVLLSGPPKYREVAALSGIDVGSTANNHALDFGQEGHRDTLSNLRAAGITPVGFGGSGMSTKTIDGVKIGFVSFQIPADRADVQKAIRTLKGTGKCSIAVVSFHWARSPEWSNGVTSAERSMARYAVNCGADLVLGHHKHLVSGIERYKGKMIAYDLGNFISLIRHVTASGNYVTKDSMIYQQRFHVFEDGYVEVAAPNIIPVLNSSSLETFTAQPWVVSGSDASRILEKIRALTPSGSKDLVQTIGGY